jgi:membrane glycosyltransferase
MSLAEFTLRSGRLFRTHGNRRGNRQLAAYLGLTALIAGGLITAIAAAISDWTALAGVAIILMALSAIWIAGGAATALLGITQTARPSVAPVDGWRPRGSTAILITLCDEPPIPLALYLSDLGRGLGRLGLGDETQVYVLSDTSGASRIAAEEAALGPLVTSGDVIYRRRASNTGRKPGNIADWLANWGEQHDFMVVLDTDSRMSAGRIRALIHRIEGHPRTGLLQAGMRLVPGRTRFGRHQRVSSRLLSPNFGRGLAAWAGVSGNYWGHNAIIRISAFDAAVALPCLSGSAPLGGPPLSHDFIEAAWIRRAGWEVELDPDPTGSAEDGPQTLTEFHARDRRWCQGNLQHLRLLAEPGLNPVSRLHLASGIISYLAAPIWLIVIVLITSGSVSVTGIFPVALVVAVLLIPKLCALAGWLKRAQTKARRRVILRASASELGLSTLLAPLVMVRQTGAVLSVLIGRDCGWKSGRTQRWHLPRGVPEAAVGLSVIVLAISVGSAAAAWWLLPVALPLVAAPVLIRTLDAGA